MLKVGPTTVLVTGATGPFGRAVSRRLVADLAEHARLLATIGEQEGYARQSVARAAAAASGS